MPPTEQRGPYWIERRHRPGYYSDHGLGGEMIWYEPHTEVTIIDRETGDVETLQVEGDGYEARVSWRMHEMTGWQSLTGRGPVVRGHDLLVTYWIDRRLATLAQMTA